MDKRNAEIDGVKLACDFLCSSYPQFFELSEYTHPVKGVCTSLVLKTYGGTQVDLSNFVELRLNFDENRILMITEHPTNIYTFNKFITDESVM